MSPELFAFSSLVDQLGRDWENYKSRLDDAAKRFNSTRDGSAPNKPLPINQ